MAISLTVLEFQRVSSAGGPIAEPEMPALSGSVGALAAAGSNLLETNARVVEVRNNTAGDSVLVSVNTSAINSALTNARQVTAGNRTLFFLPPRRPNINYYLDVRAG